jgi:hypothetical protein
MDFRLPGKMPNGKTGGFLPAVCACAEKILLSKEKRL